MLRSAAERHLRVPCWRLWYGHVQLHFDVVCFYDADFWLLRYHRVRMTAFRWQLANMLLPHSLRDLRGWFDNRFSLLFIRAVLFTNLENHAIALPRGVRLQKMVRSRVHWLAQLIEIWRRSVRILILFLHQNRFVFWMVVKFSHRTPTFLCVHFKAHFYL